ncbi:MAG: VWA domain-containing protein [Acidobacteria bacterium]|nr:VWA domain-containing protein [Acidobacteriota bacterium]
MADPAGILPSRPGSREPGPAAAQTWIFLFDLNHLTPGGGFDRARKAVEEFIRDRFKDGDLAGILAGDKMINNRLTSVRQELLDNVKQVKPRSDSRARSIELTRDWPRFVNEEEAVRAARNEREVVQRVVSRACSDDPDACRQTPPDAEVMEKARRLQREIHGATLQTLSAVNALASGLARVPGPKTIVFLSDGFVVQDIESSLRSVVGQTARAGARVYGIDVRGLNRAGNAGVIDQRAAEDPFGAGAKFDGVEDGSNSLAVDTGGLMIRNENNIGRALDRIAEDAGRYYVLAYQPANSNFDGNYRPIQVRVKRDGLRARARRGYLALPPSRMLIPEPIRSPEEVGPALAATPERAAETGREPASVPAVPPPVEPPSVVPSPDAIAPANPPIPAHARVTAAVRLRPDAEGRLHALSARETTATDGVAKGGWDAYQRGDVEAAAATFARAAAQPGVRPWVLYALGMSQAALGRAAEAIASWERVRSAAPDFEPVYMDLADTYAQVSELTRALAVLRDAEKRWPSSADVQSAIGVIHVRRGAVDDGIGALVRAATLAPSDGLTHLNLGRAYALRFHRGRRYVTSQRRWVAPDGDRAKAIEAFRECVKAGGPYARQAGEELTLLEWSK